MTGARNMNAAIFMITMLCIDLKPLAIIAAPAKPPISVWDDDEGIPSHQVARFQIMAAITPDSMTGSVMYCSNTVFETVFAIPNSPIIYLAIKNATKLKNAAQITAWNGVRTLVDTIVAIELAAS
jgi:hypothetical protein